MEGTFKNHLVQVPDQVRANQTLKHVNEGIVQRPLEH